MPTKIENDVARIVKVFPGYETEVRGNEVYVNFDFSTALVFEPEETQPRRTWHCVHYVWDATHGVASDDCIASGRRGEVTLAARRWLRAWEEQQELAEAELDYDDDEDYGGPDRQWEDHYRAHSSSITGIYEGI